MVPGAIRARLLDMHVLSEVVHGAVDEVRGMSSEEVASRILPTVEVSLACGRGGRPFWDVRAFVSVPDGNGNRMVEVIIALVEDFLPLGDVPSLVDRAVASGFGLLADELEDELSGAGKRAASKTYNVWMCVNAAHEVGSSMSAYQLEPVRVTGGDMPKRKEYDLLSTVIVTVGQGCHSDDGLLSLLEGMAEQ